MSADRVHVEMELVQGSEPIRGTLENGGGDLRPFLGWIELTALIEAARITPTEEEKDA
jgi:hypothetical protein